MGEEIGKDIILQMQNTKDQCTDGCRAVCKL